MHKFKWSEWIFRLLNNINNITLKRKKNTMLSGCGAHLLLIDPCHGINKVLGRFLPADASTVLSWRSSPGSCLDLSHELLCFENAVGQWVLVRPEFFFCWAFLYLSLISLSLSQTPPHTHTNTQHQQQYPLNSRIDYVHANILTSFGYCHWAHHRTAAPWQCSLVALCLQQPWTYICPSLVMALPGE